MRETNLGHCIAIAEPSDGGGTWRVGLPGATSAAEGPKHIASQVQDAGASGRRPNGTGD